MTQGTGFGRGMQESCHYFNDGHHSLICIHGSIYNLKRLYILP
jgi:hypothetical protein